MPEEYDDWVIGMVDDPKGEFLNTYDEWHALWFGIIDNLFILNPTTPAKAEAIGESHYYMLGALLAKIIIFAISILIGMKVI